LIINSQKLKAKLAKGTNKMGWDEKMQSQKYMRVDNHIHTYTSAHSTSLNAHGAVGNWRMKGFRIYEYLNI